MATASATPYQLTGPDGMSQAASGCTMANAVNFGAFAQATIPILNRVTGRLSVDEPLVITPATGAIPVPVVGGNLRAFMANRLNMSFTNLNCQNFGLTNPVTVTVDASGVATAATFNTTPQQVTDPGMTQPPRPGQRMGRGRHRLLDPSGR